MVQNFTKRLFRKIVTTRSPFQPKTLDHRLHCGKYMVLDTNDMEAWDILVEDAFEVAVRTEFARLAAKNVNILDIGSNIGYYSILASSIVSPDRQILAFEPQPRVMAKFRRNIERNKLENIKTFEIALSDTNGTAAFYLPKEGDEVFGSLQPNEWFDAAATVEVQTRRLDDLLAELGNPPIGLIKLDAEGAEMSVLKGASALLQGPNKPIIIFEAIEMNSKPFGYCVLDLLVYVRDLGYTLRQLDGTNWVAEPA